MACTTCGSNAPCRCSTCTDTTQNSCCQPNIPATPLPFYACAPACPENHTQKIVLQQFYSTINVNDSWNVPACGETATITSSGLKSAEPGSYIWNATYGYFEVTAFNASTGQLTVLNNCNDGNASPGTNIPACTEFVVTVPPCECPTVDSACVAIDFTAPANGVCIPITLTNLDSIQASDVIQIGAGRYTVQSIDGVDVITICNDGLGLTPGTAVIAKDAAGNYQYCITVTSTCCERIQEEFGGDLTPCSNFENLALGDAVSSSIIVGPISLANGEATDTNAAVITFNNTSSCRDMQALMNVTFTFSALRGGTTGLNNSSYYIFESIDGNPAVTVFGQVEQWPNALGTGYSDIRTLCFNLRKPIAAGASHTYSYFGRAELTTATGDGTLLLLNLQTRVVGIGIAV